MAVGTLTTENVMRTPMIDAALIQEKTFVPTLSIAKSSLHPSIPTPSEESFFLTFFALQVFFVLVNTRYRFFRPHLHISVPQSGPVKNKRTFILTNAVSVIKIQGYTVMGY
jgi:hypothetical protein